MATTDPRETIEAIVDGISTTIDDGSTAASICFRYTDGPSTLKELFNTDDYDVIISIDDPTGRHGRIIRGDPVEHNFFFSIHVQTINKYDSSNVLIATGPKMQFKVRSSLFTEMEKASNRLGTGYVITNESLRPQVSRIGGMRIWQMSYTFTFQDTL